MIEIIVFERKDEVECTVSEEKESSERFNRYFSNSRNQTSG